MATTRICILALTLAISLGLFAQELRPTEVIIAESQSSTKVSGGGSSGIGGDSIDLRYQSAWFYGDKPIVTCYNHIPSFGVSRKVAENTLKDALTTWAKYFGERKESLKAYNPALNTNFSFKGNCKGDEDLRIYFGTGPIFGNLRDQQVAQSLGLPLAYVNKTYISTDQRWSRGYIRLVSHGYYEKDPDRTYPNWERSEGLKAMLLHEIGHVLGFEHIPGTIMRSAITEIFLKEGQHEVGIDGARELLPCPACSRTYHLVKETAEAKKLEEVLKVKPQNLKLQKNGAQYQLVQKGWKMKLPVMDTSLGDLALGPLSNFASTSKAPIASENLIFTQLTPAKDTTHAALLERSKEQDAWILRVSDGGELKTLAIFSIEVSGSQR